VAWSAPREPDELYVPSNVLVRGGRIVTAEAVVVAREAPGGTTLWRFTPDAQAALSRTAADDGAVYFGTGDSSHTVYALGIADGHLLWRTRIGPDWEYRAWVKGVSVAEDTLYAGVTQYRARNGYMSSAWVFALDKNTGRVLWSHQSGSGSEARTSNAPPTIAGSYLLASDYGGNAAYALDRLTGREIWRTEFERSYAGPVEAPVVVGNVAYVGSGDTRVYALDVASGRVLWSTPVGGSIWALAVCADEILANDYRLVRVDRHTGRVLGLLFASEDESITSAFAVLGDRAFVSGDKAMYMIRCG
jgi:serine/threonine-protein kinase